KIIDCARNPGQDGGIQAGVEFPMPRFVDKKNGTVKDRLTGLIWLKNANCLGFITFTQALFDTSNLASGSGQCDLSDGSTAGEWPMPNVKELESLIDWGFAPPLSNAAGTGPFKQGDPFNLQVAAFYWSSTSSPVDGPWDSLVIEPDNGRIY